MSSQDDKLKKLKDDLYKFTMEKNWEQVAKIYRDDSNAHEIKLTKSEDTALHIAISTYDPRRPGNSSHVEQMIDDVSPNVLSMKDARGDTPLHIAAAVEWVQICRKIATKHWKLVQIRNKDGETPLFIAAHQGNLEAFLCLRKIYNDNKDPQAEADESLCRRIKDGNTILHSAISGEHFSLADKIISDYPKLIDKKNVNGESPLHVLARKPNVFQSSYHLGFYESIIYKCAIVDDLKQQTDNQRERPNRNSNENDLNKLSGNWRTCLDLYDLGTRLFRTFTGSPLCKEHHDGSTDEENQRSGKNEDKTKDEKEKSSDFFPPNYTIDILLLKFAMKAVLIFLGIGFWRIRKIQIRKKLHTHASEIMKKMIEQEKSYKYDYTGQHPGGDKEHFGGFELPHLPPLDNDGAITSSTNNVNGEDKTKLDKKREEVLSEEENTQQLLLVKDSPIVIAAKMGIREMVETIISIIPIAIRDLDSNGENLLMVAAENKQTLVFEFLKPKMPRHMLRQVDNKGNNVLHHAATLGEQLEPWRIAGAALQMQWEIKWYKQVEEMTPAQCVDQQNLEGKTPTMIFTQKHDKLVKNGNKWLIKTSESCSLVATLIAAVAFATSSTVPGGLNQTTGYPVLKGRFGFHVFSIASLAALFLSVTALVFFLTIITSRCEEQDFAESLPRKLLIGLTSLFASIAAILISFCAGHDFVLEGDLRISLAFMSIPVAIFAIAELSLYTDLLVAAYRKVPIREHKVF